VRVKKARPAGELWRSAEEIGNEDWPSVV
jgi:hypothetical protein